LSCAPAKETASALIPIVRLDACETNGRGHSDPKAMQELTDSIRESGIINPLIVRPLEGGNRLEVVCGHRRLEAARRAGRLDVPVIERQLTDQQAAELQLTENLQREDLSPLDEALAIERLLTLVSLEEAATRLGKSRSYLATRMVLTRLPQGARLALEAGTLNLSVAVMIARVHDEALREKVALEVQDGRPVYDPAADEPIRVPLSVAETREAFARTMLYLAHATFDPADHELCIGVASCTHCPKRTGNAPDLFGDVADADVCTDPACFAQKRDAGWASRKAETIAKGYTVLPDKRAKRILLGIGQYSGRGASQIRSDSGFVGPADKVGRDGDARQWLQVAKAAKIKPTTFAVRDPSTDKPVLLWRVEDLAELLPASETARKALPKSHATSAGASEQQEKKRTGTDDWKVEEEARPQLEEAIATAAQKLAPLAFLRMFVALTVGAHRLPSYLSTVGVKGKKAAKDLDASICQAVLVLDSTCDAEAIEKALGVNTKPILAAAKKRLLERAANSAPEKGKKTGAKKTAATGDREDEAQE
jgi:ParB/RepB/Spo0J family partition protein